MTDRPADAIPGLAARRAALDALVRVLAAGDMLSIGDGGAAGAEAHSLADITLRRLGQIDSVLDALLDRTPPPPGRELLRMMAAEILFHRTPPHAAVDLAVRLAKQSPKTQRLSGLVNAIGRRIGDAAELAETDEARAANMPGWLASRLAADWGADAAAAIAAVHLDRPGHDLTLRSPADADALAAETGGVVLPTGSVRLPGRPALDTVPGFATGAWWVQDAAAAIPARMLGDVAGLRVLDLCAAPGGKTLQLAAAGAKVTALDISEGRMTRLAENLARTGLSADLVIADALTWTPETPFDAVLVDVPCSATGTLRRHPDLAQRRDGKALKTLLGLQRRLLARAAGWLVPDGRLVYAVCSLLREEGEKQASRGAAGLVADPLTPGEIPTDFVTRAGMFRTRPDQWADRGGLDGFFAARFRAADGR